MTTMQSSNGNLFHWHGVVPSRHEQIAGRSTVHEQGRAVDVVRHPPAALAAVRRVGRARHRTDRAGRPGVERPGARRDAPRRDLRRHRAARRGDDARRPDRRGSGPRPARAARQRGRRRRRRTRTSRRVASSSTWASPTGRAVRLAGLAVPLEPRPRAARRRRRRSAPIGRILGALARRPPTAGPAAPGADPRQPLAGIRMLDFSWAIAGPLGDAAARRPRRRRRQDRVRAPPRPDPPHRTRSRPPPSRSTPTASSRTPAPASGR